jgi:dihydroflavonol-4-reductase
MADKMILITGATGLLGAHTLCRMLQNHDRLAALHRKDSDLRTVREIFSFYTKDPDALLDRIDWRIGDLLDKESLVSAMEGIDCVVNCAAIVSFDPRDRHRLIANNVQGTKNLVEAMQAMEAKMEHAGISKGANSKAARPLLIHISSTSALGDAPGNDPLFLVDEETPRDENKEHTGYSVSKFESEKIVRESGLNAVILNPGIILGPGQWTKGSSQLFVKAWEGLKYYPYGGTGYVDVRDVAEVVERCWLSALENQLGESNPAFIHHPPERYCLVGANLRYREFFNLVTDEYGKPNPTVYAGKFLTEFAWRADTLRARLTGRNPLLTRETAASAQRISFYSSEKIKRALGFEFRPIEETIDWVAGWFKKVNS